MKPADPEGKATEDVVPRAELRAAVALIHEVAPPGLNPEREWQERLRFPDHWRSLGRDIHPARSRRSAAAIRT
ncbi:hypothetical protein L3i22_054200 [Actinoplanes sp. L3-i22]|nr:hypothetical protein L3i22_054200 [Actinoplanes sp. L3-i22]